MVQFRPNRTIRPVERQTASSRRYRYTWTIGRSCHRGCGFEYESDRIRRRERLLCDALEDLQEILGFTGIISDQSVTLPFDECDVFIGRIVELHDLERPLHPGMQAGRE